MQREIKFRVFVKPHDGRYRSGMYSDWGWISQENFDAEFNPGKTLFRLALTHPDDFALMQYIGDKDVNGREVYENDIIKCVIRGLNDEKPVICIVKWLQEETRFVAQLVNGFMEIMPLCYRISAMQSIEVIGNIYENPDLLNP